MGQTGKWPLKRPPKRFSTVNSDYADRNYQLIRTNSVLAAWMAVLGALCSVAIIAQGGAFGWESKS